MVVMESSDRLKIQSFPKLAASILLCIIVGSIGSLVTITGPGSWYASLQKPFFAPPNWVFAPVWITLFVLMGIALYLVWQSGTEKRDVRIALGIFCVQFFFNVIWSFLFFGLQSPLLGFIDILILWVMIELMSTESTVTDTVMIALLRKYRARSRRVKSTM